MPISIAVLALAGSLLLPSHAASAVPTAPASVHARLTAESLPRSATPSTDAFIDEEANLNGEPISSVPGQSVDPATYAGQQFQSQNVATSINQYGTEVTITAFGPDGVNGPITDDWTMYYAPQSGILTTGDFSIPSSQPGHFSISNGRGCGWGPADVDVLDATVTSGQLTSFAATFEYHCALGYGATTNPAIFGEIVYNSSVPMYAADLSTDVAEIAAAGTEPSAIDVTLTNTGQTALHPTGFGLGGSDPQDFELYSTTCEGSLDPGSSCDWIFVYLPPSEEASDTAVFTFNDELAEPQNPIGENGLGSGRHILLYGDSFNGYYVAHSSGAVDALRRRFVARPTKWVAQQADRRHGGHP